MRVSWGFCCEDHDNPADFFLDIITSCESAIGRDKIGAIEGKYKFIKTILSVFYWIASSDIFINILCELFFGKRVSWFLVYHHIEI